MTESMDRRPAGHHLVLGPPPLPWPLKLMVAGIIVVTPLLVLSVLVGGHPAVLMGVVMLPAAMWAEVRRWRRMRVTAWEHRLVFDNGHGPMVLDRDAIAGFEIAVPSSEALVQELRNFKTWTWKRPMVLAVRHAGGPVPLFATARRRRDARLAQDRARLDSWLRPPAPRN